MLNRAHTRKNADVNQIAKAIVDAATGFAPPAEPDTRNPAAVALSKLGASKGGKARAASMTPAQRKRLARKAVKARWSKRKPRA